MPVYKVKLPSGEIESFQADSEEAAATMASQYYAQLANVRTEPSVTDEPVSPGQAALRGLGAGATLNWGDEMKAAWGTSADNLRQGLVDQGFPSQFAHPAAAIGATVTAPWNAFGRMIGDDGNVRPDEESLRAAYETEQRAAQEQHPWMYGAGEAAGALGAAAIGARTPAAIGIRPADVWASRAMYPVIGGAEGALYGSGGAQPGERATGAAMGGTLGAATGLALPALLKFGRMSVDTLRRAYLASPDVAGRMGAMDAIKRVAELEGVTVKEVSDWMADNPNLTLADYSDRFRNLMLEAMARGSKEGRETTGRFFQARNRDAASGLPGALDEVMGTQGRTYRGTVQELADTRGQIGREQYQGIFENAPKAKTQAVVDPKTGEATQKLTGVEGFSDEQNKQLLALLRRPDVKTAMMRADRLMANEGIENPTLWQRLHWVQHGLNDMAKGSRPGTMSRAQRVQLKREVQGFLDDNIPGYKDARGQYADTFAIQEAAEAGRNIFKGNKPFEDLEEWADLEGDAKKAFVVGVKDAIKQQVLNAGGDAAKETVLNQNMRSRLRTVLGEDADEIFGLIDSEIEKARPGILATRVAALDTQMPATITGGTYAGAAIGNPLIVASGILNRLQMRVQHMTPEMADKVMSLTARRLDDPQVAMEIIEMLAPEFRRQYGNAALAGVLSGKFTDSIIRDRGALEE